MRTAWIRAGLLCGATGIAATFLLAAEVESAMPQPITRTLPNGVTVAVLHDDRLPMVRFHVLALAGQIAELDHQGGVANLTADLLLRGTASRSAASIREEANALGAQLAASASRDVATLAGEFLVDDFDAGLELIADCIRNPLFAPEEIRRVKSYVGAGAARSMRSADFVADLELWSAVFRGHPYARPQLGVPSSFAALDAEAIRFFHRSRYVPEQTVVAIAGDVDPERAFDAVADRFGDWGGLSMPLTPPAAEPAARRIRLVDAKGDAALVKIGLRGPARGGEDEVAIAIAAQLLGGGAGSRFDKLGRSGRLSRSAQTAWIAHRDGGLFSLSTTIVADSVAVAVERLLAELGRLVDEPPQAAEFGPVVKRAAQAYPLRFETLGAILQQWSEGHAFGLPDDNLEREHAALVSLDPAALARAIGRWIDPGKASIVVVGPQAIVEPQLARWGRVEVGDAGTGGRDAEERPEASPAQIARGRELITQAIEAHGGLKRLREIDDSTLEFATHIITGDLVLEGTFKQVRREPDRMAFESTFEGVASKQVLDGDRSWVQHQMGVGNVESLDSLGVLALRNAFASDIHHLLLGAAAPEARVAHRGRESVGGRMADAVEVRDVLGARVLYVDAETHRIVAMDQHPSGLPGEGYSTRRIYKEYRQVEGIAWPYVEERMLNGELAMRLSLLKVAFNTGVEDIEFERPTQLEEPTPR